MSKNRTKKRFTAETRREAIMDSALDLFLEKGFDSVSVDEIIARSGGSKSSVYQHFGTKKGLFREIVSSISNDIEKAFEVPAARGRPPREVLTELGVALCSKILNCKGIGLYRLAVASSIRFPEVSRLFYEAGPLHSQKTVAKYLKKESDAGRLNIKDPMRASQFFLGMLLVRDHIAMPLGCAVAPGKAAIRAMVDDAVDVFMAAYGVRGTGGRG